MIKQRHSEVAQQYGSVILKIKSQENQLSGNHSYGKQRKERNIVEHDNSSERMHDPEIKYNQLSFYPKQIVERQSRSRSRPNHTARQERDESNTRPDRSRSKSRDIFALYTGSRNRSRSSTPAGSLGSYLYTPSQTTDSYSHRSRSCTPARSLPSYQFYPHSKTPTNISRASTPAYAVPHQIVPNHHFNNRSRSLARPEDKGQHYARSQSTDPFSRARSESRCQSMARDAISLCSQISTQSRALSNSEIASQNLELWMSTSSKLQRSSSQTRKPEKKKQNETFVTLLEMDPDVNEALENLLNTSHSLKPANVRMMMIAGHTPAGNDWESKDEIQVKPGAIVTGLYKQNEWLFIKTDENKTGFVPYAYTKAVKVTPLDDLEGKSPMGGQIETNRQAERRTERGSSGSSSSKSGILKSSSSSKKVLPNPSRTLAPPNAVKRESLSSNNSVFLEDLMVTRPATMPIRQVPLQAAYADCLVVDTDHKYDGIEDLRAYCSDSGISEPNSNHSDEFDSIVSPGRQPLVTPGSRASVESDLRRSVMNPSMLQAHRNHSDSELVRQIRNRTPKHDQISFMPLGPLGERLQGGRGDNPSPFYMNIDSYQTHNPSTQQQQISSDMRARAQNSQNTPSQLAPEIPKDYNGPRVRVIYSFRGDDDDDLDVDPGEIVTILNGEDIEWIWVQRRNGREGFIPREYVLPLDVCRPKVRKNHHQLVVAL